MGSCRSQKEHRKKTFIGRITLGRDSVRLLKIIHSIPVKYKVDKRVKVKSEKVFLTLKIIFKGAD